LKLFFFSLLCVFCFVACQESSSYQSSTPTSVEPSPTKSIPQDPTLHKDEPQAYVKTTETESDKPEILDNTSDSQTEIELIPTKNENTETQGSTKPTPHVASLKYIKHAKIDPPKFINKTAYKAFDDDITSKLSQIVANNFDSLTTKMGISVAVFAGDTLWSEAKGNAYESVPLRTDQPIGIMSTSKTFISALILKQIEADFYSLNDRLSDLLKGHSLYQRLDQSLFPDSTVEELLLMRGGHGDKDTNSKYLNYVVSKPDWHPSDYLALTTKPGSNPGGYEYSNNSSVLLGLIAQFQSQKQLATLYEEDLFQPLSLQIGFRPATRIPDTMALPHANYSMYGGYGGFGDLTKMRPIGVPDWYKIDYFEQDGRLAWAGAGGFTTPENMAIWGYELYSPKGNALSDHNRNLILKSIIEEDIILGGVTQRYGYHIAERVHPMPDGTTIKTYGHPGGGGGYSSVLMYSPKLDISISVLANSELGHQRGTCDAPYMATGLTCITYEILSLLNSGL